MLGVAGFVVTRCSVEGVAMPGQLQDLPTRLGDAFVGLTCVQPNTVVALPGERTGESNPASPSEDYEEGRWEVRLTTRLPSSHEVRPGFRVFGALRVARYWFRAPSVVFGVSPTSEVFPEVTLPSPV
jgi:hypothetical protein